MKTNCESTPHKKKSLKSNKSYIRKSIYSSKKAELEEKIKTYKHENDDFFCPICLMFIAKATCAPCGHTFCEICISDHQLYSSTCVKCNTQLRKSRFGYSILLDNIIDKFIKNNCQSYYQQHQTRMKENKEWNLSKRVVKFEVGEKVDVRDPNHVWCVGTILRIIKRYKNKLHIVIHYNGKADIFDEEIPETSHRFASYGFYTSRKDIPKYKLKMKDSVLRKQTWIGESILKKRPTTSKEQEKDYIIKDSCSSSEEI